MSRVLVIESDAYEAAALATEIGRFGIALDVARTLEEAWPWISAADAIVCALVVDDAAGESLARRLREHAPRTPLLLLGALADTETRVRALDGGADIVLERPITAAEISAQVRAMLAFVERRAATVSVSPPSAIAAAVRGDLSLFPISTMLMLFEMERRSGTLEVTATNGSRASLRIGSGCFGVAAIDDAVGTPLDVVRTVLSWRSGRFSFAPELATTGDTPMGATVLEAMRLEDEKNARR